MKRLILLAVVCVLPYAAAPLRAQQTAEQHAQQGAQHPVEAPTEALMGWRWANFLVLAGVIGWLVKKHAGPYYAARSLQIKKDMIEAADFRQRAEERAAQVERRLAGLEADIAALRSESAQEAQAESERLTRQTAAEIAKIEAHAKEQIASAGKAARMELKRYSVELAIGLARQKIETRITPDTQDALVRGFVRHLETPAPTRNS
ncbi:MAG TPA: ATP synthase F0 subunit B [Bryobacteraceae bacterium]|nr:ATP synthase F0 subunit B [Bryobacteraceae bacterium]